MYRVLFRSFLKINFHYESDRRYLFFQHQSAWNENWNRFFFYLRKENGGSGVLINVIVNSIDNSNLPVVCRYCRLIIFFTNVETFWYIQVCLQPDSAKIVHILQALPVWFLLTQNCMLKFIPFDFHIWRHRYWKNLAVTNQIPKIQIKDSKKIKKIL